MKNLPFFTCASGARCCQARSLLSKELPASAGRAATSAASLSPALRSTNKRGRDEVEHRRPALLNGLEENTDHRSEAAVPLETTTKYHTMVAAIVGANCAGSTARNSPAAMPCCSTLEDAQRDGPDVSLHNVRQTRRAFPSRAHHLALEKAARSSAIRRPSRSVPARRAGCVHRHLRRNRARDQCARLQSLEELVEHRRVQFVLAAEVVIEQRLVDASGGGDGVHPRTGQAVFGEFQPGRRP